jgi:hypothetical protein
MPESRQSSVEPPRGLGITIGATVDLPGLEDDAQAWRYADEIREKIAAVLADYGPSDRPPLVNVWDSR